MRTEPGNEQERHTEDAEELEEPQFPYDQFDEPRSASDIIERLKHFQTD